MRSVPQALTTELNKDFSSLGHLIELDFNPTVYRYTDKDLDVVYNGNTYLSRGIEFDNAQYSLLPKVDNLSFQVDNVSLEFSLLVSTAETRGKKCTIYRAAFDDYLQVVGAAPLFVGFLDKVEIDNQRARFDVYNHFLKWNTPTPRRKHEPTCRWTFKDLDTCRYTGGTTTCDKSWEECSGMSNTANFSGFRWLPALGSKKVYWGRNG